MLASTWHRSGAEPASLKCYSRSLEITVPGFKSSLTWETLAFLMLMGVCCIPERPNSSTTSIGSCNGKVQSSSNVWVMLPSPASVSSPGQQEHLLHVAVFLETSEAQYRPCSTELAKLLWPFSITMTLLALFADPKLYPRISVRSRFQPPTESAESKQVQPGPPNSCKWQDQNQLNFLSLLPRKGPF